MRDTSITGICADSVDSLESNWNVWPFRRVMVLRACSVVLVVEYDMFETGQVCVDLGENVEITC
jgi:hypothetical protein